MTIYIYAIYVERTFSHLFVFYTEVSSSSRNVTYDFNLPLSLDAIIMEVSVDLFATRVGRKQGLMPLFVIFAWVHEIAVDEQMHIEYGALC